jgi:hypothetical protein
MSLKCASRRLGVAVIIAGLLFYLPSPLGAEGLGVKGLRET